MPDLTDLTDCERRVLTAYNVIAIIAGEVGLSLHPDIVHTLQYLAAERDDEPLPFPATQPLFPSFTQQ